MPDIHPAAPEEAGVEKDSPEPMQIEGAEVLANHARGRLTEKGFTDRQIEEWAETFIAEKGSGDVDALISWIEVQEKGNGT